MLKPMSSYFPQLVVLPRFYMPHPAVPLSRLDSRIKLSPSVQALVVSLRR